MFPRLLIALIAATTIAGCNNSAVTAPTPPVVPTFAPITPPTVAPTATPAPAATASFGALTLVAGSAGTFTLGPDQTTSIAGFTYTVGVPAFGTGAICTDSVIGPWGIQNGGQVGPLNDFTIHALNGRLPSGHWGKFTLTYQVACTDGKSSKVYTAAVVMP